MGPWDFHVASTLGLLLGLSLCAGILAEFFRLPKVTAYLLVGVLLGPSCFDVIPADHRHTFDPILKLAIALVLFNLGSHFPYVRLRRIIGRAAFVSLGELALTFTLVTSGLLLVGQPLSLAILLGCLAMATAPATTILVLKEYRSEGPITEYTSILVAINNFACILAFEIAFLIFHLLDSEQDGEIFASVVQLTQNIMGSISYGLITGLVLSYLCNFLRPDRRLVLLIAVSTFLLGICESLNVPFMLTFLVMGATVANTSNMSDKIVGELESITGLLCVAFFAVHGTELDLVAFQMVGVVGVVYIVCRSLGKVLGVYASAKILRQTPEVQNFVGISLLAQAGAAIALSTIAVNRNETLGLKIQPVILGTVVVFELVGPILIRHAVLRGGEVPISHAVHHTTRTPLAQLRDLADRFLVAIGRRNVSETAPLDIAVDDLIRRDVTGINQSASFDHVISQIEQRHENTLPVVDDDFNLVGVIRYALLSSVMFDRTVSRLVRAEDLATPIDRVLHPDQSASEAIEAFHHSQDDCIPVVTRDEPHKLLGVVTRSDAMHLLIQQHRADQ